LADLDRRVQQIAQQAAGQLLQQSRRSNTVGLKIPYLVCDLEPVYNTLGFYDLIKATGPAPQRGSEIDTAMMTSTTGRPFQALGKGIWLVCVGVDVEVGERIGDALPHVSRTRASIGLDIVPNLDLLWGSGSSANVWDSSATTTTSGLGSATASLTGWFLITTAGTDPQFPRPNARASWTPRVYLEWNRIFSGSSSFSRTRTLSNASALIIKIDSWLVPPTAFVTGNP
jgi:hypothetical protein